MTDADQELIKSLINERKTARNAFYANPTLETKAVYLAAAAECQRIRTQIDPEFKKKRNESTARWRAKQKLGIGSK